MWRRHSANKLNLAGVALVKFKARKPGIDGQNSRLNGNAGPASLIRKIPKFGPQPLTESHPVRVFVRTDIEELIAPIDPNPCPHAKAVGLTIELRNFRWLNRLDCAINIPNQNPIPPVTVEPKCGWLALLTVGLVNACFTKSPDLTQSHTEQNAHEHVEHPSAVSFEKHVPDFRRVTHPVLSNLGLRSVCCGRIKPEKIPSSLN